MNELELFNGVFIAKEDTFGGKENAENRNRRLQLLTKNINVYEEWEFIMVENEHETRCICGMPAKKSRSVILKSIFTNLCIYVGSTCIKQFPNVDESILNHTLDGYSREDDFVVDDNNESNDDFSTDYPITDNEDTDIIDPPTTFSQDYSDIDDEDIPSSDSESDYQPSCSSQNYLNTDDEEVSSNYNENVKNKKHTYNLRSRQKKRSTTISPKITKPKLFLTHKQVIAACTDYFSRNSHTEIEKEVFLGYLKFGFTTKL